VISLYFSEGCAKMPDQPFCEGEAQSPKYTKDGKTVSDTAYARFEQALSSIY
jgi:hypothetical protein